VGLEANPTIGIEVVNRFRAGADAGSFSDVQEIDID
jgi:hypothetical protein